MNNGTAYRYTATLTPEGESESAPTDAATATPARISAFVTRAETRAFGGPFNAETYFAKDSAVPTDIPNQ